MKTKSKHPEPYVRLTAAGPYMTCPTCHGKGGDHITRCHDCLGVGFVSVRVYEALARRKEMKKPPRAA